MLKYEITDGSLIFTWTDDETLKGYRYRKMSLHSCGETWIINAIAQIILSICNQLSKESLTHYFYAGRQIFEEFKNQSKNLPPSRDDWGNFILCHYEKHLNLTHSTLKTRINRWALIATIYKRLQRSGVIPEDVYIPQEQPSAGLLDENLTLPLGQERKNITPPTDLNDFLSKRYLVESGLNLAEDQYLLDLKRTLELRASTVLSCGIDYWERMIKCHEMGQSLISEISSQELEKVLDCGDYFTAGRHLCAPDSPKGINWFLAIARHYLKHTEELQTLNLSDIALIPAFKDIISDYKYRESLSKQIRTLATDCRTKPLEFWEALGRLLGLLSPRDCAVACAIIATENPRFNPHSLVNVKLYSQSDNFYLRGNSDTKRITLSVSKPRARSRKESVLPHVSAKIVSYVIKCTEIPRARLLQDRKSGWRKLFLTSTSKGTARFSNFIGKLNSSKGVTPHQIYRDKFEAAGITRGVLTLFRIRCTQGILEFLRNGSIQRVADLLGNTCQVVEICYIPKWLKYRWGTRLLRILQQKFILVATEGEPWQVAASDFTTKEQMQDFIRQILLGLKKGDPLSEAIRTKLGHYAPEANSIVEMFVERELLLSRSPIGLAAIYAYADAVELMPKSQHLLIDAHTQLPLWIYPTLKKLIIQTTEIDYEKATNAETSITDRISSDSLSEMKKVHRQALQLSPKFRALIDFTMEPGA